MSEPQAGLTIKAVSQRTGVSVYTLRAWERRYGVPQPRRGAGNRYRLYDEQDVADVLWLKRQIESGLSPSRAGALRREHRTHQPDSRGPAQPLAELRLVLESALVESDEATARKVLDQLFGLFPPEQVALHVIVPTMQDLGTLWQQNKFDVWQEHLASNLIRQRILSYMHVQPDAPRAAPSLIAACAPEEEHELGLLLFALLAGRQGWHVDYLGQRTPLDKVIPRIRETQWVAISVTTPPGLASLVPLLDQDLTRNRLLFGGLILNQLPRLQEHLPGIFLGENASDAVRALTTQELAAGQWRPSRDALRAGLQLQRERLKLSWQAQQELEAAGSTKHKGRQLTDAQRSMPATLFYLIDALSSALAFDVPELLDAQGLWLSGLRSPRGITTAQLNAYQSAFTRVLEQSQEPDVVRRVGPLLERLQFNFELAGSGASFQRPGVDLS